MLNKNQIRALKALAHHLNATIIIGNNDEREPVRNSHINNKIINKV